MMRGDSALFSAVGHQRASTIFLSDNIALDHFKTSFGLALNRHIIFEQRAKEKFLSSSKMHDVLTIESDMNTVKREIE